MPNYRRVFIPGGCYFFTVNLLDRRSRLLVEHVEALRNAVVVAKSRRPFHIDAMVVLPDHLHAVWTLPPDDADFSSRWRDIKIGFSKAIPERKSLTASQAKRGERGLWQRRFWEHVIRDERDFHDHIDYCWYNPVKHGLVENVEDWPYSSFHRDARDTDAPFDRSKFAAAMRPHAIGRDLRENGETD